MKSLKTTFVMCIAMFGFLFLTGQAPLIDEDFSSNPFDNANIFTSYDDENDNTACTGGYRLGDDMNAICPGVAWGAQLPALTPANNPMCMSINQHPANTGGVEHLYADNSLMVCAGRYRLTITSVHRYNPNNNGDDVDLDVVVGGNVEGSTTLPYGNGAWVQTVVDFTVFNNTTGFAIDVINPALEADYAVDHILLELVCPVGGNLTGVPSCTDAGDVFTLQAWISSPLDHNSIEAIYTNQTAYEVVGWSHQNFNFGWSLVSITFETISCSCTGEMLSFDIRIKDCPSVIWLMTRNIPCCESDCTGISLEEKDLDNDCYIVNGDKAFDFSAEVWIDPGVEILGVTATGVDGNVCSSEVPSLSYNYGGGTGGGTLEVEGIITLDDPDCEYGDIVLQIDTKFGCCEIPLMFSMPDPCDEDCLDQAVTMDHEITAQGENNHQITISIPYPAGTSFDLLDNETGAFSTQVVQSTICAPFTTDKFGNQSGTPCTGYTFNLQYDCDDMSKEADTSYDFTIRIGDCEYHLIGDYCDLINGDPNLPHEGPGGVDVIGGREKMSDSSPKVFDCTVFPNPAQSGQMLTIKTEDLIKRVEIYSTSGMLIYSKDIADYASEVLMSEMDDLRSGLYLVKVISSDNQQQIRRITIVE